MLRAARTRVRSWAAAATAAAVLLAGCSASSSIDPDEVAADAGAGLPTVPTAAPGAAVETTPTPELAPTLSPTPSPAPTATEVATATPEPTPTPTPTWSLTITEIDRETRARIEPTSWRPGCPVPLGDLRLLTFPYVNFDDEVVDGELIVAARWAAEIGSVFEALFEARYPIQRIELVDAFGGDDLLSMQANNTSGFNCREVAGKPGVWSNHALGSAIDLNPLMNPYVQGAFVDPPEGADYLDRTDERIGMVLPGDPAVDAFLAIGWRWGGNWVGLKDYQHFSANGR